MGERADEIRDYADNPADQDQSSPFLQDTNVSGYNSSVGTGEDFTAGDTTLDNDDTVDVQTEMIRDDIEQTRAEMARTVDEIQARLSPQNIVEHAKETAKETAAEAIENVKQTVHDATVGKVENMVSNVSDTAKETGSGLIELIKENPVPAALAGLGLGWLYMKRQNQATQNKVPPGAYTTAYAYPYGTPTRPVATSYTPGAVYSSNYSATSSSNQGSGGLMDKIRQNPIPAAVAGVSLGYLLMKGQGQNGSTGTSYTGYNSGYNYGGQYSQSGMGQVRDKVGDVAGQAGQRVGDIASGAGDVVGQVGQKVGDIAGGTAETVGDIASNAAEAVGNIASGAGDVAGNVAGGVGDVAGNVVGGVQQGAQKATNELERMLQENPLAVGGVALVVGAVIGMMLPATEKENQLLGKVHDNLMEKAGEAVQQTMDKVGNVTEQVTNTAKEEARNQGLTQ